MPPKTLLQSDRPLSKSRMHYLRQSSIDRLCWWHDAFMKRWLQVVAIRDFYRVNSVCLFLARIFYTTKSKWTVTFLFHLEFIWKSKQAVTNTLNYRYSKFHGDPFRYNPLKSKYTFLFGWVYVILDKSRSAVTIVCFILIDIIYAFVHLWQISVMFYL